MSYKEKDEFIICEILQQFLLFHYKILMIRKIF